MRWRYALLSRSRRDRLAYVPVYQYHEVYPFRDPTLHIYITTASEPLDEVTSFIATMPVHCSLRNMREHSLKVRNDSSFRHARR